MKTLSLLHPGPLHWMALRLAAAKKTDRAPPFGYDLCSCVILPSPLRGGNGYGHRFHRIQAVPAITCDLTLTRVRVTRRERPTTSQDKPTEGDAGESTPELLSLAVACDYRRRTDRLSIP
jgi:hypothetical protein